MKRKYFLLWVLSVFLLVVALLPFFRFMFNLNTHNLVVCLLFVAPGAVLYALTEKRLTHPKGYTLFNAMEFYRYCVKNGISDIKFCRRNPDKITELALHKDYSKNLNLTELYEMYETGYEFVVEKGLNR